MLSCVRFFCNPIDCSLRVSSAHEILQARRLEWVASPSPRDLRQSGSQCASLVSPALAGRFFTTEPPGRKINRNRKFSMIKGWGKYSTGERSQHLGKGRWFKAVNQACPASSQQKGTGTQLAQDLSSFGRKTLCLYSCMFRYLF